MDLRTIAAPRLSSLVAGKQAALVSSARVLQNLSVSATRDVGLGTAYERWAIYRLLDQWLAPAPPATALEGPADGMAGMPGLHLLSLARRGTHVTVVLPEPEAVERVRMVYARAGLADRLRARVGAGVPRGERFELVLGFNFAHQVEDWRAHLRDLAVAATRRLAVFATHPASYGAWIRRGLRRIEPGGGRAELFDHEACRPAVLRPALERHGRVTAERYVDCPWWPDLFVSAGQTLAGATMARLRGGRDRGEGGTRFDWGPERFPFAKEPLPAGLRAALRRHPGFDRAPEPIAGLFAHHRAYLVDVTVTDLRFDGSDRTSGVP